MFPLAFDENCAFAVLRSGNPLRHAMHPEEARLLGPRASVKRRRDFVMGRAAANLALKQLGFDSPPPVLQGKGREPLWPQGIVGSITHSEAWAVAAAARRSSALTIGIDLESVSAIHRDDIGNLVCRERELDWAAKGDFARRLTMVFSAKETIFKAFYPLCRRFIDFRDVNLWWISEREMFAGELLVTLNPDFPKGYRFEVGCQHHEGLVFTSLVLKSPSLRQNLF